MLDLVSPKGFYGSLSAGSSKSVVEEESTTHLAANITEKRTDLGSTLI